MNNKLEELSKLVRSLEDNAFHPIEEDLTEALRTIYEILQETNSKLEAFEKNQNSAPSKDLSSES